MQQKTSNHWYYCGCVVAELLQNCCTCCRIVAETVALTVTSCCILLHYPFIVSCNNLQQVIFYHFFRFCNRNVQFVQHNLQHIFIHEYCIFIHLQQFLQQFQSNFTINCHLYLLPVSTFLTLFRSKLYASSISL